MPVSCQSSVSRAIVSSGLAGYRTRWCGQIHSVSYNKQVAVEVTQLGSRLVFLTSSFTVVGETDDTTNGGEKRESDGDKDPYIAKAT